MNGAVLQRHMCIAVPVSSCLLLIRSSATAWPINKTVLVPILGADCIPHSYNGCQAPFHLRRTHRMQPYVLPKQKNWTQVIAHHKSRDHPASGRRWSQSTYTHNTSTHAVLLAGRASTSFSSSPRATLVGGPSSNTTAAQRSGQQMQSAVEEH